MTVDCHTYQIPNKTCVNTMHWQLFVFYSDQTMENIASSTTAKLVLALALVALGSNSLSNISHAKPSKITVIIGLLHISNFKSPSDIIRMCLYGKPSKHWDRPSQPGCVFSLSRLYHMTTINLFKQNNEMAFHWCQTCLCQTMIEIYS